MEEYSLAIERTQKMSPSFQKASFEATHLQPTTTFHISRFISH